MAWVDLSSLEGRAELERLRVRDPGEHRYVYRFGHASLCRCCMRQGRPNKFVPCDCWWGSGGPVGRPPAPTAPLPTAEYIARWAAAELRRIEFGVDFECPSCGRGEKAGHASNCELAAILADASLCHLPIKEESNV